MYTGYTFNVVDGYRDWRQVIERQWKFVSDMNYSGAVTISDFWEWVQWLFFYPGDVVMLLAMGSFHSVGRFFEVSPLSYGGVWSGIFSGFLWLILYGQLKDGVEQRRANKAQKEYERLNAIKQKDDT
jgi:hypothetical protein